MLDTEIPRIKTMVPESKISLQSKERIVQLGSFILGFSYCAGLKSSSILSQNIVSILFIASLIALFIYNLKSSLINQRKKRNAILIQIILLNVGIATSAIFIKAPTFFFWTQDSIQTHLPQSLKYAEFFKGNFGSLSDFFNLSALPGKTTHIVTGFSIALFGINPFATIVAQLFFKILTVLFIYSTCMILWSQRISLVAIQLYAFCPTIFYYNLVLYKESAVQAMFAGCVFFALQSFIKRKLFYTIPLFCTLWLLMDERFYMTYLLIPMPVLLFCTYFFQSRKILMNFIILMIIVTAGWHYQAELTYNISSKIQSIQAYRKNYSEFSDVLNQYNYQIPYPLAFIKILFSPYLTFNKFKIFHNLSTLLTWGSLINQLITGCSILSIFKLLKKSLIHFYLWLPFILFLIIVAYISPWSGRLRDGFYPLISCYAAYFLVNNSFFQKKIHAFTNE